MTSDSNNVSNESATEQGVNLSRRDVISAGVAGVVLSACSGDAAKPSEPEQFTRPGRRHLNSEQSEALNAMLDRLIPGDSLGPGAVESRAEKYIEHLFRQPYINEFRDVYNPHTNLREAYTRGLTALHALARQRGGAAFAQLTNAQQDELLSALQANEPAGFEPDARSFFGMVRQHAIEGMFGDPCYGGNAHFAGWKLLGFPGVRLAFASEETQLGRQAPGENRSVLDYSMFGREGI
jgi:hypothetical protein